MPTTPLKIHRVNALPGTPEASSIYIVKAADTGIIEIYVTSTDGTDVRHLIKKSEIQALIDAGIAGLYGLQIVADITARNAASPTTNALFLVLDASADGTVTSGSAMYAYQFSNTTWHKVSEFESLDVTLNWASLADKPTSLVADIDDAVTKKHTHTNSAALNKIGENVDGYLTYNSNLIAPTLTTADW